MNLSIRPFNPWLLPVIVLVVVLMSAPAFGQDGSVTIDRILGLYAPDTLCANRPITFIMRLTNNSDAAVITFYTPFNISSPDGATWGGLSGEFLIPNIHDLFPFSAPDQPVWCRWQWRLIRFNSPCQPGRSRVSIRLGWRGVRHHP